jgi:hypothetical protein
MLDVLSCLPIGKQVSPRRTTNLHYQSPHSKALDLNTTILNGMMVNTLAYSLSIVNVSEHYHLCICASSLVSNMMEKRDSLARESSILGGLQRALQVTLASRRTIEPLSWTQQKNDFRAQTSSDFQILTHSTSSASSTQHKSWLYTLGTSVVPRA